MTIDLLYVDNCPNRASARRNLDDALGQTGLETAVHERAVNSVDEAARLGMNGSPTVLIDGRDPFAVESDNPSLSCRLYRHDEALLGFPSVSQLIAVLGG